MRSTILQTSYQVIGCVCGRKSEEKKCSNFHSSPAKGQRNSAVKPEDWVYLKDCKKVSKSTCRVLSTPLQHIH